MDGTNWIEAKHPIIPSGPNLNPSAMHMAKTRPLQCRVIMVLVVPSYACAALDALLALGKVVVICWKRPLEVVLLKYPVALQH